MLKLFFANRRYPNPPSKLRQWDFVNNNSGYYQTLSIQNSNNAMESQYKIIRSFSFHHNQHGQSHNNNRRHRRQRTSPNSGLRISKSNPFAVLGIPQDSCAETVKRKFLQLALRHHPDTSTEKNSTSDTFVKIREAFEQIKRDFASRIDADSSSSSWLTEEEFDAWFYEETGQKMDAATRRDVMHVYKNGLTRTEYGPVWEIAFILEEEGFFTHKEKTLPRHQADQKGSNNDNSNGDGKEGRTQERASRRKRSF
jgi:hypothetical protein